MKKSQAALIAALVAGLAPAGALAQVLTLEPGYSTTNSPFLSVPYSAAGFDYDGSGNLYFMGASSQGIAGSGEQDQVIEATAASGYASFSTLVQYSTPTYGAFVTYHAGTVYYGDSDNVNAVTLPVTSAAPPSVIATATGNYDLEFSGTTAFLSANPSFSDNEVYVLNQSTGQLQAIVDTDGDFSGPIALTSTGGLIYGASGYVDTGIYVFSAASVNAAIASGSTLQLSQAQSVISDTGNSSFAMGPNNTLYQVYNPFGGTSTISSFNLTTGSSTLIGTLDLPTEGIYFDGVRYFDGDLTVAETNGSTVTNFYDIAVIPEPGAVRTCLAGMALLAVWELVRCQRRMDPEA